MSTCFQLIANDSSRVYAYAMEFAYTFSSGLMVIARDSVCSDSGLDIVTIMLDQQYQSLSISTY